MPSRLYLDNAATSFPKPPSVTEAMVRYANEVGGSAGRGSYAEAREGGRIIRQCRERVCRFINGESVDHVVFTLNTSDALNLAINGIVWQRRISARGKPIHLVGTEMEHNSVLRPFNAWTEEGVEWTCVKADPHSGLINPEDVRRALRPETALVALNHASNVTGTIQPAAEIGLICRGANVPFLLDVAQSLGHIPIDVRALSADLVAFPGHKGLLGPLGTGGLYLRPGMEKLVRPVRTGGTGSSSEQETQPAVLPDRYEPGSQNGIGLAGLSEGVAWLLERGESLYEHDRMLRSAMLQGLRGLDAWGPEAGRRGWRLMGPTDSNARVGVFTLTHAELSPHEVAGVLEQEYGILVRAGLHCAPRAHAAMGTRGGAVRVSFGPFNTVEDVARIVGALRDIAGVESDSKAANQQN